MESAKDREPAGSEMPPALPLRFHKFFRYVTLPLSMVLNVKGIIDFLPVFPVLERLPSQYRLGTYCMIVLSIISLLLFVACIIGLFSWKRYAYRCIMAILVVCTATEALNFFVFNGFVEMAGLRFVGRLIYSVLVAIYYRKRNALFS